MSDHKTDFLLGTYRAVLLFMYAVAIEYKLLERNDPERRFKIVWKEMKREKTTMTYTTAHATLPADVDSISTLIHLLTTHAKSRGHTILASRFQISPLFMSRIFSPYQDLVTQKLDRLETVTRLAKSKACDALYDQLEYLVAKVVLMFQVVSLLYLGIYGHCSPDECPNMEDFEKILPILPFSSPPSPSDLVIRTLEAIADDVSLSSPSPSPSPHFLISSSFPFFSNSLFLFLSILHFASSRNFTFFRSTKVSLR